MQSSSGSYWVSQEVWGSVSKRQIILFLVSLREQKHTKKLILAKNKMQCLGSYS